MRPHVGSVAGVGLVVQKFGGTSVADAERMRAVADHVALTRKRGDRVVLVGVLRQGEDRLPVPGSAPR